MQPRGLGRGLESLIPKPISLEQKQIHEIQDNHNSNLVPISKIKPSRYQPRTHFNQESLKELAQSIEEQGLIQPLVVARASASTINGEQEYELIAGERRWRAAQIAGLTQVPIVIKNVSDKKQFQIALVENLQREDLNPIEEAFAFRRLIEEFNLTQEELAKTIGKGRVVIANTLRLLQLPQSLQDAVSSGSISAGHARTLVSLSDESAQKELSQRILNEHLTVREVEKIVSDWKDAYASGKLKGPKRKDPEIRHIENALQQTLGTKVQILSTGKGTSIKGSLRVWFFSLEDMERIIALLKK